MNIEYKTNFPNVIVFTHNDMDGIFSAMIIKETKGANKVHGRIYTPKYIVQNIFDLAGYRGENILKKHCKIIPIIV